jgi:hypothetical protein
MMLNCKNKNLWTWSDIKAGNAICFKCLIGSILIVLIVSLTVLLPYANQLTWSNTLLISWLTLVVACIAYFKMANSKKRRSNTSLKVTEKGIAIFRDGKREAFQAFDHLDLKLASWTKNFQGLYPAFLIKGDKLGVIRVGLKNENSEWLHIKTMYNDVHFTIDDEQTWHQFERILRQYL